MSTIQTKTSIQELIKRIEYKDWVFKVEDRADCFTLQIVFKDKCIVTGEIEEQYCRKWFLSKYMTDNEIIRTAFTAVEKAEYHELCEKFKFDNKLINNPHLDVLKISQGVIDFTNLDTR